MKRLAVNCISRGYLRGYEITALLLAEKDVYDRIATKRVKKSSTQVEFNTDKLLKGLPNDPQITARFSTSTIEEKVLELSKLPPDEIEKMFEKFDETEAHEARVLEADNVMQMDVSLKEKKSQVIKVFWKDVDISLIDKSLNWYNVLVDKKPVKAFSSQKRLIVPTKDFALACAREWAEQENFVNSLLMPMTDMASGAMTITPRGITARIDYLMGFFQNDNCYFRVPNIEEKQDTLIQPVTNWFERVFDVQVPRIVGIGHPHVSAKDANAIRQILLAMNMNPYQILALCVVTQFTSSLMLSLALFNKVLDLNTALLINQAEERHNVDTHGEIKGYHDIREADVQVKIAAATIVWQLTSGLNATQCARVIGDVNKGNQLY